MPERTAHTRKPLPPPKDRAALPPDGGPDFNRLIFEQSPYLLQHAANPVDWHPWGANAFEKARRENKPLFLSVGYSTCHWCHVMERESFEDAEVAALLNELFVPVKVDREERPDIDKIYMDVTQAMTGGGGWPMTVVMTPDRKPFFAGTYFPKQGLPGRPGMMDLLPALSRAWDKEQERVVAHAEEITRVLAQMNQPAPGASLDAATLDQGYAALAQRFDDRHGGFGSAPKFPVPHNLSFLLRRADHGGGERAVAMVAKTLTAMRLGGIYDHIGFGFHRYSTDAQWLLPHFEKMLYDQALLALAYLEGYQVTGDPLFQRTAREIFTYVQRDMTSPEGGFYSAEDADSEGEEGKFYVWTTAELAELLGPEADRFARIYHMREQGNFTHEAGGGSHRQNIPHLKETPSELAAAEDTPAAEFSTDLEAARRRLFDARRQRVHPLKDDKILTDWNGLMIAAFARGARILDDPQLGETARHAADFVLTRLAGPDGRLLKRYREGQAGLPGLLEDYAYFGWGLIELYEASGDTRYLSEAVRIHELMLKHFWDPDHGGLFLSPDDGETLLVRAKEVYDGALPSGNSVAALGLLRLARLTGTARFEEKAHAILAAFAGRATAAPSAHTHLLLALDFSLGPAFEVVLAEGPGGEGTTAMKEALRRTFTPRMALLSRAADETGQSQLAAMAPFTANMTALDGRATAYVCRNYACHQPTTDPARMLQYLGEGGVRGTSAREAGPDRPASL